MFKCVYLNDPMKTMENMGELEDIVREYDRNRMRCPGKPLTDFHDSNIRGMLEAVRKGAEIVKDFKELNKE